MKILSLFLLAAIAVVTTSFSLGPKRMALSQLHCRPRATALFGTDDGSSSNSPESAPTDTSKAPATETEKPFLIFGLNPKNYNDWITVGLYGIIGYQTLQIIGEIFTAVTAPKSS